MATRRTTITQAQLTRCLRALAAAGYAGGRVLIEGPDGTRVTVIAGAPGETAPDDDGDVIDAMIERLPDALP